MEFKTYANPTGKNNLLMRSAMQLYALNRNQQIISADSADKHTDYICLECKEIVRLRSGIHRHKHFYHTAPSRNKCKLSGKGAVHISIQYHLREILPQGECLLEKSFPSISRIADVVWTTENIVFEIQCSPISAEEVRARNKDYRSEGYNVVWLLHEKNFNKKRFNAAEIFLRNSSTYYFTNINEHGAGTIYDQFDILYKGRRMHAFPRYIIDITKPEKAIPKPSKDLPIILKNRITRWPLHFHGDLLHVSTSNDLHIMTEAEKKYHSPQQRKMSSRLIETLLIPYRILFSTLLENSCSGKK